MDANSGDLIPAVEFSTAGIHKPEQFDAWRTFVGAAADITLEAPAGQGFESSVRSWGLGGIAFMHASLPGIGFRRRYRNRSRNALDHWCLLLTGEPHGHNDLKIRSLARDFDHASDHPRMLSLYISRDMFPSLADAFDTLPANLPATGIHALVGDHLISLMHHLPHMPAANGPALVEMSRSLLAAMVSGKTDHTVEAAPAVNYLMRDRIRRHILRNLAAADLSPDTICRSVGVSRSKLYRLFEDIGGVVSYIQRQRLLKAFERLSNVSDLARQDSIGSIAESLTFSSLSTFSRSFRSEFATTPTEIRDAAMAGIRPHVPIAATDRIGDFNQMLRGLRA